ncbi:MAG: patatin-like phospholipase family protein [Phycisphaerales bacterium]|nr:patatin-like phospholipase family protein [Phycisphaerales bacterium]
MSILTSRRGWIDLGCRAAVGAVLAFGAVGCAVNRRVLSEQELACRRDAFAQRELVQRTEMLDAVVRRYIREAEAFAQWQEGEPPTLDVLVLSGGGEKGAFGAGFLLGWSTVDGPLRKPEFDIVTGVSTGALIAPFAFVGDSLSAAQVADLYRQPKDDWAELNGWLFFLPSNESFLDPSGLRRDVTKQIDSTRLREIVNGSLQDRLLVVGTTNLDLGLPATWNMTGEAERIVGGRARASRFIDILMASSAVPAAFPPVVIDDELHVDGGTTSNILIVTDLRAEDAPRKQLARLRPDLKPPRMRFWVILNNRDEPEPRVVQPTWWSITRASVDTMVRSSTLTTLRYFAQELEYVRAVEGADIELRYVAIPPAWKQPSGGVFDAEAMNELVNLGMTMGADPGSWRTDLARTPIPKK